MVKGEDWLSRFGWTVDDLSRKVRAACAGLDRHDIDDIAQVVGVIITQRLRSQDPPPLKSPDDLARYVFRIARNYKIAWLEEKSRERLKAIEGELGKRTRQSGERTAEEVLRELSDEQREAILGFLPDDRRKLRDVMRWRLQNMSGSAIAKLLDMSEPTVSRRLAVSLEYIEPRISEVVSHERGSGASADPAGD